MADAFALVIVRFIVSARDITIAIGVAFSFAFVAKVVGVGHGGTR